MNVGAAAPAGSAFLQSAQLLTDGSYTLLDSFPLSCTTYSSPWQPSARRERVHQLNNQSINRSISGILINLLINWSIN